MNNHVFHGVSAFSSRRICPSLAGLQLILAAMAVLLAGPISLAQDSKSSGVVPAPSSGKAIVCIYRTYRFTGSSAHDELYVNGTHLAKLLNSEYAFMEVPAGTVVISGLRKENYGSVVMSIGAAANEARAKENERARFDAEAGKTYYFKWTSGPMATGIKVEPVDAGKGANRSANFIFRRQLTTANTRNRQRITPTNRRQTDIARLSAAFGKCGVCAAATAGSLPKA
jgi:hypothetical protein